MTIENLTHHAHILNIAFSCRCLSYFTTLSFGVLSGLHWKSVVLSAQVKGLLRYLVGWYRHSLPFYSCIADNIDSSELRSLRSRVPGVLECFTQISMATSALWDLSPTDPWMLGQAPASWHCFSFVLQDGHCTALHPQPPLLGLSQELH